MLFSDVHGSLLPEGFNSWTEEQLKTIRYHLIEFVTNYRTEGGKEVTPNTMRCHLSGVKRYFTTKRGYKIEVMKRPLFPCKKNVLMAVCDNRLREQQDRRITVASLNVLSSADGQRLFSSPQQSRGFRACFQCLFIFEIALSTAMRPTEIHKLLCSQVSDAAQDEKPGMLIVGCIGSMDGTCKAAEGGWKDVKVKPKEV